MGVNGVLTENMERTRGVPLLHYRQIETEFLEAIHHCIGFSITDAIQLINHDLEKKSKERKTNAMG